jgi:hypothetical protein
MDSLIDMGDVAQLYNARETRRRNDQYEQNSLLQAQQDALTARHKRGSELSKLADDERIRADPELSATYLAAAGAEFGVPETVTRAGVERGQVSLRKHLRGLKDQDQEAAMNGLLELQISQGSKVAGEMVTGFQNVQKLSEYSANVEAMRTLQGARYEALHDKQSKIQAGELPYSQGVRHFTTMLYGTESKEFERIATAASKVSPQHGAHPRTIGAALAKNDPIVSQFGGQVYMKNAEAASDQAQKYATVVGESERALQLAEMGEPLPPGTTKRDLMERVETGRTMMDAYNSVATWANDPYNLTKLKEAKAAQTLLVKKRAELETLKASTSQELIAIRQQAQSFRETEAGQKHLRQQSIDAAQNEFAKLPDAQQTVQQAGVIATKHGVGSQEVMLGIKNPNRALVEINQNSPGERKDIAEGRSQLDTIAQVETLFDPSFVGPADARVGRIASFTGLIQEQEAEFRSAVTLQRTELRKFYFGTAQSKQELQGALESIPDLNMSDAQFKASVKETKRRVTSILSRRAQVMRESGVRTPGEKPSMTTRYHQLKKIAPDSTEQELFSLLREEGYQ